MGPTCKTGFHLDKTSHKCKQNVCTCTYGVAQTLTGCTTNGKEMCSSCVKIASANKAATRTGGESKSIGGVCSAPICNTGNYLLKGQQCIANPNKCTCEYGTKATGPKCLKSGVHCSSCVKITANVKSQSK